MIILTKNIKESNLIKKVRKEKDSVLVLDGTKTFLTYKYDSRIFKSTYHEIVRTLISRKHIRVNSYSHDNLILRSLKPELVPAANYFVEKGLLKYKGNNTVENDIDWVIKSALGKVSKESFISELLDDNIQLGKYYSKNMVRSGYSLDEINKFIELIHNQEVNILRNKLDKMQSVIRTPDFIKFSFNTSMGRIMMKYEISSSKLHVFSESISKNQEAVYYFNNGVIKNVFFTLRKEYAEKKIKTKNLVMGLFGFTVFVIFSALTFTFVFSGKELGGAFVVLGKSWGTPWPYLFIMDYFINTFAFLIIAILLDRAFTGRWSYKGMLNWFVASNFRWLIYQVTGFHMIATAAWIFLMRKKLNMKTATLVGNMGSIALIQVLLKLTTGLIFVSYGSWFFTTLDWNNVPGIIPGHTIAPLMITSGLLGLTFWALGNLYMILFVYSKRVQNTVFKLIIFSTTLTGKNNYFSRTEQMQIRINQMRSQSKKRLKDKRFLTRAVLVWAVFFVSEMFAMTYTINMFRPEMGTVGLTSNVPVIMDVWNLSASWQLIKYSNESIWLPGGMGMIETYSTGAYSAYMSTKFAPYFSGDHAALTNYIQEVGPQAAVVERFFGYYIPFITRVTMVTGLFGVMFIKKIKSG